MTYIYQHRFWCLLLFPFDVRRLRRPGDEAIVPFQRQQITTKREACATSDTDRSTKIWKNKRREKRGSQVRESEKRTRLCIGHQLNGPTAYVNNDGAQQCGNVRGGSLSRMHPALTRGYQPAGASAGSYKTSVYRCFRESQRLLVSKPAAAANFTSIDGSGERRKRGYINSFNEKKIINKTCMRHARSKFELLQRPLKSNRDERT
ncbi:hypothetical protein PUN28_006172 [Cardiocondyla obscurior]|uniref:Uncharacterized protein n=1 Tax=Cardiocondyla obscurior TaxID=286306 RepID=A0AAW2GDK0_9HYME